MKQTTKTRSKWCHIEDNWFVLYWFRWS